VEYGNPPERRRRRTVPAGRALRISQKNDGMEVSWNRNERCGRLSTRHGWTPPRNTKISERLPLLGDLHKKMACGNLITIPKEPKRDRSSTKSYRPNCLLSMVGELLERLMAARISTLSHHLELNADRQYGFRPGVSKTNAIVQLKEKGGQKYERQEVRFRYRTRHIRRRRQCMVAKRRARGNEKSMPRQPMQA
jgi:hypothetical protein